MVHKTRSIMAVLIVLAGGLATWWYFAGPSLVSTVGGPGKSASPTPAAPAAAPPGGPQAGPPKGPPVEAARVATGQILREVTAVGTLMSNESVMIRPELAGRIVRLSFEEGQKVKKGQTLVKLDDSSYVAELEQAKASLELSRANNDRAVKLYAQGAGTERAKDEGVSKLRVDQARLEQAKTNLEKTVIVAPFDGVVGLRKVSVGAYVTPGLDIVNLESIDPIKVEFQVPEMALSTLSDGQKLNVTADAFPGRSFQGEVYAIDPKIDPNGRSVAVRARLPNEGAILRPGLFVRVGLVVSRSDDALLVPEEALVSRGAQLLVYTVVEGKVVAVPVRAGLRREGKVEILEGLKPGDQVITAGHMKVREGAPVSVMPPGGPPANSPASPPKPGS